MSDALAARPIRPLELYTLIGALALGIAPHFWNMHFTLPGFFLAAAAMRLTLWVKPARLPPRSMLLILTVIGITLVVLQVGFSEGRQFGVALLVVMLGLKLLEMRTRRDLYVVVILGYFLIITQFLFNQNPALALYLLLLVIVLTTVLNSANRIQDTVSLWDSLKYTTRAIFWSIPVMAALFVLFPRLDGPLWSFNLGATAITGMSDTISMGSVSRLSQSAAPAFRVTFDGPIPAPRDRYWRGMVLWHTDGQKWRRADSSPIAAPRPADPGSAISYQVTMEASGQRWLFPLDRVAADIPRTRVNVDGEYILRDTFKRRQSYQAVSELQYLDAPLTARTKRLGLQLPDRGTARMRALVAQWQLGTNTNRAVVERALQYFNQQPFIYTLQPPLLGDNPIDEFLFETRKGFCEHYATSFVYMMRLADIPARVIGGYQGGEVNPIGGHLLVRQADAHAWAEVWLEDEGWVRADPTAAVAPERIQLPLQPGNQEIGAPALFQFESIGKLARLARQWGWIKDDMVMSWHHWIVDYSKKKQQNLLHNLGLDLLDGAKLGIAAILLTLLLGLAGFLLTLRQHKKPLDEVQRIYARFKQKLIRGGLLLPNWMGPLDIRDKAQKEFPANRANIGRITTLYISLRYGNSVDRAKQQRLKRLVSSLRI